MIKEFLKYRRWVINWNSYLWKQIPNDYCIFFRFIFNDVIRYINQRLRLHKYLTVRHKILQKEYNDLEIKYKKLLYKW